MPLPQDKITLYKDHTLFKHLLNQEGDSSNPDEITLYTLLKVGFMAKLETMDIYSLWLNCVLWVAVYFQNHNEKSYVAVSDPNIVQ